MRKSRNYEEEKIHFKIAIKLFPIIRFLKSDTEEEKQTLFLLF